MRKAVPGVRIAYTDEREIQRALDGGALVLVVPTVDTVAEARQVVRVGLLPAVRQAQPGRRPGVRAGMWAAFPAATATRSTTTSS